VKTSRLEDMTGGWFVGNFAPACIQTEQVEVACKHYKKGDKEPKHVHRIAQEITLIVSGKVRMDGRVFITGDIVLLEPGEPTDFEALEDTINMVVKMPSVKGDKYIL
jgi:quercetin dioxygenase-like cupin family protein